MTLPVRAMIVDSAQLAYGRANAMPPSKGKTSFLRSRPTPPSSPRTHRRSGRSSPAHPGQGPSASSASEGWLGTTNRISTDGARRSPPRRFSPEAASAQAGARRRLVSRGVTHILRRRPRWIKRFPADLPHFSPHPARPSIGTRRSLAALTEFWGLPDEAVLACIEVRLRSPAGPSPWGVGACYQGNRSVGGHRVWAWPP